MRRAAVIIALGSCGGTPSAPSPASARVAIVATAEGADDAVVATVDGRPVYASCVGHQGGGREGLEECIDFELLAQAAEARGAKADPEVARALETAMVDRLVETKYEDKYKAPADFGPVMDKIVEDNARQLHRPEIRDSSYVRVVVPDGAPAAKDAAAHAIAQHLAERLRGQHGFLRASVVQLADEVRPAATAAGLTVDTAAAGPHARNGLVVPYADALWALAEVGDATPDAVRTKWGWDVIVMTDHAAPRDSTRAQLADEVFPAMRRSYFAVWAKQIEKAIGAHVEYMPDTDKQLDALPVLGLP